jgi:hypothetical protein
MALPNARGHAVSSVGSRLLACCVYMFESRQGIDICIVSVVCCQVEISGTGRSLDKRDPTEYDVSNCN